MEKKLIALLVIGAFTFGPVSLVSAQTRTLSAPSARPASPEDAAKIEAAKQKAAAAAAKRGGSKPTPPKGKPGAKPPKKGEKPKEGDETKTYKRPTEPPKPADPKELEAKPDDDGKVQFSFKGQPWSSVLDWLADISGKDLDYLELPGDFLNLTTRRPYTIEQAQDLINARLLVRGYTILSQNEGLLVVNIKNELNPSMVPRVYPNDLHKRMPNEFVKVSFPLASMIAETAAEEFKPMLSKNGKLVPLKGTNRLEATDAVLNLQEIYDILSMEENSAGSRTIKKIQLYHRKASDVKEQLKEFLGESKGPTLTPQQKAQQAQMLAQQRARSGGKAPPPAKKTEAKISLVALERENAILVNAPPDKMAQIVQAIKVIDVEMERTRSIDQVITRSRVYRLASVDPETMVKMLKEMGNLAFDTQLEADTSNKSIIAFASLVDHVTIKQLVDKLDGSSRKFSVRPLRNHDAAEVAETIQEMLSTDEKKNNNNSRYGYFSFYGYSSRNQKQDNTGKFKVTADVTYNQLLVWANEVELASVDELLEALGEYRRELGNPNTVRTLDLEAGKQTDDLLEKIRQAWPSLGNNPLNIEAAPEPAPSEESDEEEPAEEPAPKKDKTAGQTPDSPFILAQIRQANDNANDSVELPQGFLPQPNLRKTQEEKPSAPAPINISRGRDGKLIISSKDTKALDRLESLLMELAPPPKEDFQTYTLKYASAGYVTISLEEFFADKDEENNNRRGRYYYYDYYGYNSGNNNNKSGLGMGKRKPLTFVYDADSNTIVVRGGDPVQHETIKELIALWDKAPPKNSKSARVTKLFQVKYSQASMIKETIKGVYRDLLNPNDKDLQDGKKEKTTERYFFYDPDDEDPMASRYKGTLSIEADHISNTLLVSCPRYLLENIDQIVEALDVAAIPTSSTKIVNVGSNINGAQLQERLSKIFGQKQGGQQPQKKPGENGQPKPQQPNGNGNQNGQARVN